MAPRLRVGRPQVSTAGQVRDAYDECERITREQARNFAYGIRLLPGGKRRALSAVYAFSRRVDDIGDGGLPREEKLRRLKQCRESVHAASLDSADPVLVALADTGRRLPVPMRAFDELVDGCEADVRGMRYRTFAELLHYCRCVAGSVGRLSLGVFGSDAPDLARRRADALGIALQLTNILRDVREDRSEGRVYLPAADLDSFGIESGDEGEFAPDADAWAALVRFQAQRAEQWYREGLRLLPMLDRRSRACCASMAGIYHRLLRRIAADPDIVLRERVSLPARSKAAVVAGSLAGARP
ncbi:presqualene diphosphate synthase HpnD [Saccharopolyspora montiporae]|uniref:presqualene diphosphate synthase HpnD n=1 Tax=Saccharopolyspora montiporae TaxID=2781240 RepID=UPI00351CA99C